MTPFATLLARAVLVALLLLSLGANLASADSGSLPADGGASYEQQALPEDPGIDD